MERHELDLVSLVAGLLYVVPAGAVVFGGFDPLASGMGWVAPAVLIGVGLMIAAVSLNGTWRTSDRQETSEEEPG